MQWQTAQEKVHFFSVDTAADLGVQLDTDEIVKERGWDWRDASAQLRAGRELLRRQKECLEKGISFNQETTLSGVSILKAVQTAKERGYLIRMRYVGVNSPAIAKERVAKRIAMGGHGVSGETIDRRFDVSKDNLKKILPLCDTVNIYDNSGDGLALVASYIDGAWIRSGFSCRWADELISEL